MSGDSTWSCALNSFRQMWTLQHRLKHTINCLLKLTSSAHIRKRANYDCCQAYDKIAAVWILKKNNVIVFYYSWARSYQILSSTDQQAPKFSKRGTHFHVAPR